MNTHRIHAKVEENILKPFFLFRILKMKKAFPFWTNNNNNRQKSLFYLCCASFIVFFSRQICGWTNQSNFSCPIEILSLTVSSEPLMLIHNAIIWLRTADWATIKSKEKFMNFDFRSINMNICEYQYCMIEKIDAEQWFVFIGKWIDQFPYILLVLLVRRFTMPCEQISIRFTQRVFN